MYIYLFAKFSASTVDKFYSLIHFKMMVYIAKSNGVSYCHKVIARFCQAHFKFQNQFQSLLTWNGTKSYKRGIYEKGHSQIN